MSPSLREGEKILSEAEDILTIKELRDWANSPSESKNAQIRVIDMLDKKIMNLRLDILDLKKRLSELEKA